MVPGGSSISLLGCGAVIRCVLRYIGGCHTRSEQREGFGAAWHNRARTGEAIIYRNSSGAAWIG